MSATLAQKLPPYQDPGSAQKAKDTPSQLSQAFRAKTHSNQSKHGCCLTSGQRDSPTGRFHNQKGFTCNNKAILIGHLGRSDLRHHVLLPFDPDSNLAKVDASINLRCDDKQ